jgi:NADH dehydrogenase
MKQEHPIVVVGGGFAGVYATKELLKRGQRVLMISSTNHFTFTPLLHEVATGSLTSHDISFEYETFFQSDRFEFLRATVEKIDPKAKKVLVEGEKIRYAALVLATGATTNFYKMTGVKHVHVLKTTEDAVHLKRAIITRAQGPEKKVTVTIIGGGPTGLELVFDVCQMLEELRQKHHSGAYKVRLVHGSDVFCGNQDVRMQQYIRQALDDAGVELVLNTYAEGVEEGAVLTTSGKFESDVTVVCAGVKPNTEFMSLAVDRDEHGHVLVNGQLQTSDPHIFALGDIISMPDIKVPKLAQTAVREAPVLAANVVAHLENRPETMKTYHPEVKGMLFSLGFGNGVGVIGKRVVKGIPAWYLWRTVYLFKTPGFWNKLRVAFGWTVDLFQGRNLTEL